MTIRLLYHDPKSPGGVSPFDEAILSIAREGELKLACPYISLDYLNRVINGTSWRLLTDIQEWLDNQASVARSKVVEFLSEHHACVRNYPRLHAKVVIGSQTLMFGSANFTHSGILSRAEVSAIIDDAAQVGELTAWFEACWSDAQEMLPRLDAIADYAKSLPDEPAHAREHKPKLFPSLSTEPAILVELESWQTVSQEPASQPETQVAEQSPAEVEDDVVFPSSPAAKSAKAKQGNSKKDVRRYLFRVIRIGRTAQEKDIPFLHALAAETATRSPDRFGPNASNAGITDNERRHRTAVRLARTVSEISLPALRDAARDVKLNRLSNQPQYSEEFDDEVRKELGVE